MSAEDFDDELLVSKLKSDAAVSAKRYEMVGLEAYMPKSRPTTGAPKPNTRFLRNILRETDSHNAALLAKEAEDARARLRRLKDQKDGKLSPHGNHAHHGQGQREAHNSSKRRRDEDGDNEKGHRRKRRPGETDSHRDRRDRSRDRDRDRRHGSSRDKEKRRDSSRYREGRKERVDRTVRDEEEKGESSKHAHRRHRSRDRKRRDRSRSRTISRDRSHRHKSDSHRDHRRRRSRSRSSSRSRSPRKSRTHHKSTTKHRPPDSPEQPRSPESNSRRPSRKSPTKTEARRRFPSVASDSDPLEGLLGPAPPPPQPKVRIRGRGAFTASSTMDRHFSNSYDPTADLQPNSDAEDDWDEALEVMGDRAKWKQQQADRLRSAGFTDAMVKKWEKGGEKTEEDVVWAKKGEGREWDRGKVVDVGGDVDIKAEWGRLKGT